MLQHERVLTSANVGNLLKLFSAQIDQIGHSIAGKTGLGLIETLKRERLGIGPYPDVTLFEAANRIMSDLVILHGVAWLLKEQAFPFAEYTVEFGNEDKNGFDIMAKRGGKTLVGEAFNVAPSFFQGKKLSALKKLRKNGTSADYRVLLINHDAVRETYLAKGERDLFYLFVNVRSGEALPLTESYKAQQTCESPSGGGQLTRVTVAEFSSGPDATRARAKAPRFMSAAK